MRARCRGGRGGRGGKRRGDAPGVTAILLAAGLLLGGCAPGEESGAAAGGGAEAGPAAGQVGERAGGGTGQEPEATGGFSAGDRVVFTCDDGYRFAARFREDAVALVLPWSLADLPAGEAPGRFADGQRFLRVYDDGRARYESPDGGHRQCRGARAEDPRHESALLGFDYRAQGQEPGWVLEVDLDGAVRYLGDYGETVLVLPAPTVHDSAGSRVLTASTAAHRFRVVLTPGGCADVMSGDSFPESVDLLIDGRPLTGCGGPLDP